MSDIPRDALWSEADPELPSELSELLRAGRAEIGSAEEVSELARRLAAVLGPGAGLPGDGSSEGASARNAASRAAQPPPRAPAASAVGAGGTTALGASRGPWRVGGIGAALGLAVTAFVLVRGPSAPPDPTAAATPVQAAPSGSPVPSAPRDPSAGAVPASPSPPAEPAPAAAPSEPGVRPRPLRAPELAAQRPHAKARAASRAPRDGATETTLLEQARAALQTRPAEALELTRRHEGRFPHGALVQEREVIAIEALQRLGRKQAASARAAEFERRYSGSVHQPRLLRSTDTSVPAGGGSNTAPP